MSVDNSSNTSGGGLWQVEIPTGEVYEVELDVLKQWIAEGHVQPASKVRKGNLRWVEAGRAPALKRIFYAAADELNVTVLEPPTPPAPSPLTVREAGGNETAPHIVATHAYEPAATYESSTEIDFSAATIAPTSIADTAASACHNHPQTQPAYICRACAAKFCRACPKFISTSKIALCPLCSDLCQPYAEVAQRISRAEFQTADFGVADFKLALRYPFRHLVTLLCGAGIYGVLLLAGFQGQILACALLFGCISHAINNVVAGKLDRSFMPEFDMSAWWDEVGNPLLLSLAIIVVTWGPAIILAVALLSGALGSSSIHATAETQRAQIQAQANSDLAAVLNPDASNSKDESDAPRRLDPLHAGQYANAKEADVNAKETAPKPAETKSEDSTSPLKVLQLFHLPAWAILLWLLALGWALCYYPMALLVAGYTENFASVINPLVGLDTIRRMGATYGKAFAMYLVVQVAGIAVGLITSSILSPFDLPFIGNLPAKFANGVVTVYTSMVIAFILGVALYKCADKLDINVD